MLLLGLRLGMSGTGDGFELEAGMRSGDGRRQQDLTWHDAG